MPKLLLIDDDSDFRSLFVSKYSSHFSIETKSSFAELKTCPDNTLHRYQLFLIDIHLKGSSGFEVINHLKERIFSAQKILALSFDESTEQKILALKLGASDYLWKSMNEEEFFLRICNAIEGFSNKHPFVLVPDQNLLAFNDDEVKLTPIEFRIVDCLTKLSATGLDKEILIKRVWPSKDVSAQTLNTHIFNINQKIVGRGATIRIDRKNKIELISEKVTS